MAPDPAVGTGQTRTMDVSYAKVLLMELAVLAALWWLERAFL
jgi:hypothetical protein